ncbi:MAG: DUF6514 family protein [bacterium]|nr:DUF6514 family protein [bacterium]
MREQKLITTKVAGNDDNKELMLEYYLTEKESEETKELIYGISVTKRCENQVESDVVDNISYEKQQVLDLLHIISENTVTPICLAEVLDDLMTERMYS